MSAGWRKGQVSWSHVQWWYWKQLECWLEVGVSQVDTFPVEALETGGVLVGGKGESAGHMPNGGIVDSSCAGWRKGQVNWTHVQWWYWKQLECWLEGEASQQDICPVVALETAGVLVGGRGESAGHMSSGGIGNSWSAGCIQHDILV